MSETLIIILISYAACLAVAGIDAILPGKRDGEPGSPKRSSNGAFTAVALFGVISAWALPQVIGEFGLPAGYGALMIVAMAIVMSLLTKRLWIIGRLYQTRSQVMLIRLYYQDTAMAGLVSVLNGITCMVLVALIFHLVGSVVSHVSGLGVFGFYLGIGAITISGYVMCMSRERRRASRSDLIGFIVYILGMIALGVIVLGQLGGFDGVGSALGQYATGVGQFQSTEGHGGGDFPVVLALPGVFQNVLNVQGDFYVAGPWTGLMILSASLCALGLCASQLGIAQMTGASDTRALSADQVTRYALLAGGLAVVFAVAAGAGAVVGIDFDILRVMAGESAVALNMGVRIGLSIFGLIILTSAVALLLRAFAMPIGRGSDPDTPSRLKILMLAIFAGFLAFIPLVQLIDYVTLMLAMTAQLLPLVFGMCWVPWFTRQGVYAGLVAGIVAVLMTDFPGPLIQKMIFGDAVWGVSPMTMHSAGWGIAANMLIIIVVSAATQSVNSRAHRTRFAAAVEHHAAIGDEARGLIPVAWIFTISWFLFALGPGAVIGNSIFGAPDQPVQGWNFSIPSIWAWQIFMWIMGVALVWFLATRLGVSSPIEGTVNPTDDIQIDNKASQESG